MHELFAEAEPEELDELTDGGYTVKSTTLTPKFTLDHFREQRGEDAVIMFTVSGSEVTVVTPETKIADEGVMVVALVPPEPDAASHD